MLTYTPGSSLGHRLDPRTKLVFQLAFAVAAFAHTTPQGLAIFTVLAGLVLWFTHLSPVRAVYSLRVPGLFLIVAPLLQGLTLGAPWFSLAQARGPALASYRVAIILVVTAAYVHTTPARETRAAIERVVPGRPGRFLGAGVGLVVRFLPVLQADLRRARDAVHVRLGDRRPFRDRARLIATTGIARALDRADALALAMRARCFAWNPTLPELTFHRRDYPVGVFSVVLVASVLL